jgi:hypothetical protein
VRGDIVVDESSVYVHSERSGIIKLPKDLSGAPRALAPAGGSTWVRMRQTADAIFWVESEPSPAQLHKVAKDGSGAFAIPAPYAFAAAIAGGYVYVADASSVSRTATTGPGLAPLQKIADLALGATLGMRLGVFAEADDDSLFVYPMSGVGVDVVTRVDLASERAAEFARFDDPDGVLDVQWSGANLFVSLTGRIVRVPKTGGAPALVRTIPATAWRFLVDGGDLYFLPPSTSPLGGVTLMRAPVADPSAQAQAVTPSSFAVGAFAVDATAIYFVGTDPANVVQDPTTGLKRVNSYLYKLAR